MAVPDILRLHKPIMYVYIPNFPIHTHTYFPACDPIQTVSLRVERGEVKMEEVELWRGVDWWLDSSEGT